MKYYCNPLNLSYTYQVFDYDGEYYANREAADPSMILFKGKYYLFPSMTAGFFVSDDLYTWEKHYFGDEIPLYDYAPDVRVIGDYMYFSASRRTEICDFYRTKDPINGSFEKIDGSFPFWDPNLFCDDDGRIYFYWGCSNQTPIWGVELDPATMRPIGEQKELIFGHKDVLGYERKGPDHYFVLTPEAIEEGMQFMVIHMFPDYTDWHDLPADKEKILRDFMSNDGPFVEGAWMTKHDGKYYLQYAVPATEVNTYGDGVYVSDSPLGPFTLAPSNPFSYHPGGFIRGAGHGSTMEDKEGNWWHISSMSISTNRDMERRLGLWQTGWDKDGDMWCDQRFGDWPRAFEREAWSDPEWMLLSLHADVTASSVNENSDGTGAVTDENIKTVWQAAADDAAPALTVDLGAVKDVRAIQVNFGDNHPKVDKPSDPAHLEDRHIVTEEESGNFRTRWMLEVSADGDAWTIVCDRTNADTDLPHELVVCGDGIDARYIRLHVYELPFGQAACVSGIRVFGKGAGEAPSETANVKLDWQSDLDVVVSWDEDGATGHLINWGYTPDKLYHSYMVFDKNEQKIGAVIKDAPLYFRVDSFNEVGVTRGTVINAR